MDETENNPTPERSTSWWRRSIWWIVAALPTLLFVRMAWDQRWMSDDGFINLRVVRNILGGHGPVFNVGERVEAYTSALWVGLITIAGAVGVPLEWAAVVGGITLAVAGLVLAQLGAVWLHTGEQDYSSGLDRGPWTFMLPIGALVYAVVPPAWDYASSGLETGLALCWLGGASVMIAGLVGRWERHADGEMPDRALVRWRLASGTVVGLGPLIRPELTLFSVGWLCLILLGDWLEDPRSEFIGWKPFWTLFIAAGAIPVAYQLFRMGYFSALVPNTAFAKSAFRSNWKQGWLFARNFFGFYMLAIPLGLAFVAWIGAFVGRLRDRRWLRAAAFAVPVACGLGYGLYVAKVGGGFMHGRLWLPVLFGLLLPVAMVPVRLSDEAAPGRARRWAGATVVVLWAVACGMFFRIPEENKWGIGDERNWYSGQANVEDPVTLEDYRNMHFHSRARQRLQKGKRLCPSAFDDTPGVDAQACRRFVHLDQRHNGALFPWHGTHPLSESAARRGIVFSVLRTAIGIKGMVLGPKVHLVDQVGLADPIAARLKLNHRGRPGHEKNLNNAWYVGRMSKRQQSEDARVTAARAAMGCGRLGALMDGIHGPLGVGKFLGNIGRAVSLHGLEVPDNPFKAYYKFCGAEPPFEARRGGGGGNEYKWRCPVGWSVSKIETTRTRRHDSVGYLRAWCRPVDTETGQYKSKPSAIFGPSWGKRAGQTTHLSCPDGQFLVGLIGRADGLVRRVGGICGQMERQGDGWTTAETSKTDTVGVEGKGKSFELRCPDGQVLDGLSGRAGAAVDATGVVCRPLGKIDVLEGG